MEAGRDSPPCTPKSSVPLLQPTVHPAPCGHQGRNQGWDIARAHQVAGSLGGVPRTCPAAWTGLSMVEKVAEAVTPSLQHQTPVGVQELWILGDTGRWVPRSPRLMLWCVEVELVPPAPRELEHDEPRAAASDVEPWC